MSLERRIRLPCPPFDVQLSHWDRIFPPTHSRRILCFGLPPCSDRTALAGHLHVALHFTVQRFPPLAGRIVPFPESAGGRPWLRNVEPRGAARLDIADLSNELSFRELQESNFSQKLLRAEQLCAFPEVAYVTDEPVDVCGFKATLIDGGLLLTVSVIHIVADGRGVSEILKIFADAFVKAQRGELAPPLELETTVYRSDRTELVSGGGLTGSLDRHPAWTSVPTNTHAFIKDTENSASMFRISANNLVTLKEQASRGLSKGEWISTGDAVGGLIWRSIMVARHQAGFLSSDSMSHLVQPVDFRPHLRLPEPYFGNCLYMTKSSVAYSELANPERGLQVASSLIRRDLMGVTADRVKDLLAYSERTELETHTCLNVVEEVATGGIILSSHLKFDLYDLDFGPAVTDGRVQAQRFPERGTMRGAVIVMPKLKDGSCEFLITELDLTLGHLMNDGIFTRFADRTI